MDDLLREFLTETSESLDTVDNQLVKFEQEPNNAKILDNIFRLVHTIKGTCGFLGLPRLLLPKNRVKLLLNMLVVSQHTIPRGGMLTIDPIGEGETMSFRITATGHNARLPQNISELLSGERGPAADAHAIQPYYTRLLAQACGLTVTLKPEGEAIIITAS